MQLTGKVRLARHALRPTVFRMPVRALSSFVVTPSQLSTAISENPGIIPVCGDWYLPNDSRKGLSEFSKLRIPNARFFDLDQVIDHDSPYPHMLPPSGETFAAAMSELGIQREDTVVVYDSPHLGVFAGPRVAWTFKVFGHEKVHLLNNFKVWVEEGRDTEAGEQSRDWEKTEYPVTQLDRSVVVGFEEMVKLVEGGAKDEIEILDARPAGRFDGTAPEPRPGLSSGHAPGAISLPFGELLDTNTKALKSPSELRDIFLTKGINPSPSTEKILLCGTGVTAVVLETALQLAGIEGKRRVYDGSWTEWAQRVDPGKYILKKSQA